MVGGSCIGFKLFSIALVNVLGGSRYFQRVVGCPGGGSSWFMCWFLVVLDWSGGGSR